MLMSALLALWWRPDVSVLAMAMLWPVLATLVVSLRIAARLARTTPSPQLPTAVYEASAAWPDHFRRDVLPIGAGIVLSALYFRIDVFLIQLWSGTAAVALYSAVFRLVEALRLFPAAVLAVTLPDLCRAPDRGPIVRVSAGVTVFAVAAAFALWAAAPWLIPLLYGPRYAPAVPAFRILALVVSAAVAQLRADTSAHRLGRPACVCRDVRSRARREPGAECLAHSHALD